MASIKRPKGNDSGDDATSEDPDVVKMVKPLPIVKLEQPSPIVKREEPSSQPVLMNEWIPLDDVYEYRRSAERGLDIRRIDTTDVLVALLRDGSAQIMSANSGIKCTVLGNTLNVHNSARNLDIKITPDVIAAQQDTLVGVYHGDNASAETVHVPAKRQMKLPIRSMRRGQEFTKCKNCFEGLKIAQNPGESDAQFATRLEGVRRKHLDAMGHLRKRVGIEYEMCACTVPVGYKV